MLGQGREALPAEELDVEGETMLTEKQKQICEQYRRRDREGKVRCRECPLAVDHNDYICRANADYNPHTREWEEHYLSRFEKRE